MKKTLAGVLSASMLLSVVPMMGIGSSAKTTDTVEGLTMTSYSMVAKTAAWDEAYALVMMQDAKNRRVDFEETKLFDSTLDDLLYWSYKVGHDDDASFEKFNGTYYKSFGAAYQGDNNYLIHWTGTVEVAADVTFTVVGNKMDNGFVLEFDGERAYEYWGNAYFDKDEDRLPSDTGAITLKKGTHQVNAWFLELTGGEALAFGAYVGDSEEYKSLGDIGLTFDLEADVYHSDLDRWGSRDATNHPYVKAFIDAGRMLGVGTNDSGESTEGGNGGQCVAENQMYDATIDAILAASKKVGTTVVSNIDKYTMSISCESYVNLYDGYITVDKTGYYLFGAQKVDNGFVVDIVDGNKTYRAYEFWANGTWNDNEKYIPFMPETAKVYLEAGKTYGFKAAFLELDGGQVLDPRVKYSADGTEFGDSQKMNEVLHYTTTAPTDNDKVDSAVLTTEGAVLLNDKVTNISADFDNCWGDGAVANIFDNDPNTKLGASGKKNGVVAWTTSEATTITHYQIIAAADNGRYTRTPLGWTLEGSNDGKIYYMIDHVSRGESGIYMANSAEGVYAVDEPTAYTHYRLRFVGNWDNGYADAALSFADLNLYNVPKTVTPPTTDAPTSAPETGSAVVALAMVGTVSLAGVMIASKKRHHD